MTHSQEKNLQDNSLADELRAFVKQEFVISEDQQFDDRTNLVAEAIIDSFGLVQLILFAERLTGRKLSDDDMVSPELASIDGLVRLLK